MPEPKTPFRVGPLTLILVVVAVVLAAIAIAFFASSHPRRGGLFVALAFASLVGAWFSTRRAPVG